ncbi:gb [Venturia nashicola]|uniref:Gb n=1 Tax=Venturia nashicola TaxID=86259 RepID=A0A4Z1P8D1_9PEZI|nr:gb [Venturia nashicola]
MESRSIEALAITAPFLVIATTVLFLRLYTRLSILKNAGSEDVWLVLAWILALANNVIFAYESRVGYFDKHFKEVVTTTHADDLTEFYLRIFVSIFIYILSTTCAKLSVALQYRRIFTGVKAKVTLWCLMGLIVGCGIWSFCANLFFCAPIRKSWHPELAGKCLSRKKTWLSYSGANIFISTVLILLPLPGIVKLQLQRRVKVALVVIFSLGLFDIILTVLRLSSLSNLATTTDISWALQPVGIWTNLESTVAVICASLPALRPLIARAFPGFFTAISKNPYKLPSRDHGKSGGEFPIAGNSASSNFPRKLGCPGRQISGDFDLESGVFGAHEPVVFGRAVPKDKNVVETSRKVMIGPHAYTCQTKEEGSFAVGKF